MCMWGELLRKSRRDASGTKELDLIGGAGGGVSYCGDWGVAGGAFGYSFCGWVAAQDAEFFSVGAEFVEGGGHVGVGYGAFEI